VPTCTHSPRRIPEMCCKTEVVGGGDWQGGEGGKGKGYLPISLDIIIACHITLMHLSLQGSMGCQSQDFSCLFVKNNLIV